MLIYPNPAKDVVYVTLDGNSENISWTLVNMQGQVVRMSDDVYGDFEILLDGVNKGIYFLNVTAGEKLIVKKIVVE